jgi:hypothetical protein
MKPWVELTASELDAVVGGLAVVIGEVVSLPVGSPASVTITSFNQKGLASTVMSGTAVTTTSTMGTLPSANVAAVSGILTMATAS